MPKKKRRKHALSSFAFKSSSRLKADGPSALGNTFYGVDDDNNVWQINPLESFELDGQPFTQQLELEDALTSKKKSNGVAYSEERNDLFVFYNGSVAGSSGKKPGADSGNKFKILWWNQQGPEDSWDWVTGNNGNFGAQSWPTNAAYFDDSLWYFSGNGNDNKLYQLRLAFGDGSAPVVERLYQYDFPGYTNKSGYGDIAIDVERMLLYGSKKNGEFYRIDLKAVELARSNAEASGASGVITVEDAYQQIKNKIKIPSPDGEQVVNASLQLSFDADYQTLWGQTYGGIYDADESLYAGAYYLVDTATGEIEYSGYQSPNEELGLGKGFTDLGGSTSKPLAPTDPVFAVAPGQGVCVSSETSPVPVAEFSFAVDLDREDFEREYPDRAYGPFLLDVDLRGDLSAAGYRPITADSFFFAAKKASSSDFVIEEIHGALYLSVPNGVTRFRADVQLDPRDQLTGGEQLEFGLQLLDTGRLEQALDSIENSEECQPEDGPDPCTSTIDAGYFGYVGTNDGKKFQDWSLTSELNIAEIEVDYLPVAKGQVPDGWSKDGVTGNSVAAELAVVYQGQTQSPYLMRGWLDAQYKTKNVMDYAYFYLAEIVDQNGRRVQDISSLDLSGSSARPYTPEIKPSLKAIGQSAVLLYQSTGVAAPGTGSVSGNAAFWGDDVPFVDRSHKAWFVGGGSRDPVEIGEVCFGEVIAIETDASCDLPGVDDGHAALFQFDVDLDPYGDQPQLYAYEFKADGLSGDGYDFSFDILIDGVVDEGKNIVVDVDKDGRVTGRFTVAPDVQSFQLDVTLDAHQRLTGDEALELEIVSVGDGGALIPASKQSGTASLEGLPCSPVVVGEVESVEGTAACELEGTPSETDATFTFEVEFDPVGSESQTYSYAFGSNKALGGYALRSVDFGSGAGVAVNPKQGEMAEGTIEVPGGVDRFEVVVAVEAEEALAGNEALTLSIGNEASEAEGKASLKSEECTPVVVGEVESVEGTAACAGDGVLDRNQATFIFDVDLTPGSAAQGYRYQLSGGGFSSRDAYSIRSVELLPAADVEVARSSGGDGAVKGEINVDAGVSAFSLVATIQADQRLTGDESLRLKLSNQISEASGIASLESNDCREDSSVTAVTGDGYCIASKQDQSMDLEYTFLVDFEPGAPTLYGYELGVDQLSLLADYSIQQMKVTDLQLNPIDVDVVSGDSASGLVLVGEGVEQALVTVDVQTDGAITGKESLTLTVGDPEEGGGVVDGTGVVGVVEATDDEGACQGPLPQLPDANLLLLMDDSTSMLSADPSTQSASEATRLEAQNRIAFYAFEQAAERAGYGFRRKGDDKFESFGDASTDAILNNSTISLSETLRNYELVDDPSDFRRAGDLVVNQITFGYVVDADETVARSNGDGSVTVQGSAIAERILLTTTPNTVYGDSIKGNKTWGQRDLPQPTPEDLFKGRGTSASNLYSGTEMLGALDGLHTLLKRQLRRTGDGDADSTFVVMTTDGRPERRPWWDKRDDHDGLAIPLPQSLGGDAITASGLLYDDEGNWRYVRDNDGLRQWPRTRKRLNNTLDQLSEQLIDPSRQLQVEAIGLGDDVGVDYETIYTDLFETKTFDNSDSNWTYEFYPSYGLPEFLG